MKVPAYFRDTYAPAEVPLLSRLRNTADKLRRLGLVELREASPLPTESLAGLHDADYLQAFLEGDEPLASRQGIRWSPAVRDATLAMLGGQLAAAETALREGIAMNVARGFHHAVHATGSGFCPINGLAMLAHAMPERRIFVIDCDEHGGNGTEDFAARLDNLYNVSIFGTRFGCRGGVRSWAYQVRVQEEGFGQYLQALAAAESLLDLHRPDLLVYQAGADCHEHDPKSLSRMTSHQLFLRDLNVFRMARERQLPVLFLVAGGYQDADRVARLNANTVRAARWVWRSFSPHGDT